MAHPILHLDTPDSAGCPTWLGGGFGLPDDLDHSFERVVDTAIAGIEQLAEDRPLSD